VEQLPCTRRRKRTRSSMEKANLLGISMIPKTIRLNGAARARGETRISPGGQEHFFRGKGGRRSPVRKRSPALGAEGTEEKLELRKIGREGENASENGEKMSPDTRKEVNLWGGKEGAALLRRWKGGRRQSNKDKRGSRLSERRRRKSFGDLQIERSRKAEAPGETRREKLSASTHRRRQEGSFDLSGRRGTLRELIKGNKKEPCGRIYLSKKRRAAFTSMKKKKEKVPHPRRMCLFPCARGGGRVCFLEMC